MSSVRHLNWTAGSAWISIDLQPEVSFSRDPSPSGRGSREAAGEGHLLPEGEGLVAKPPTALPLPQRMPLSREPPHSNKDPSTCVADLRVEHHLLVR